MEKLFKGKIIPIFLKHKFYDIIQGLYNKDLFNNQLNDDKFVYFHNAFDEFNNTYDTTFKYYFINLYQVLKYIDTYAEDKNAAKEYTNMIRAQLTKNELVLLAYNAIGVQNFTTNNYQLLVEKYAFFEHLRYADFCDNISVIQIVTSALIKYNRSAFGNNEELIQELENSRIN